MKTQSCLEAMLCRLANSKPLTMQCTLKGITSLSLTRKLAKGCQTLNFPLAHVEGSCITHHLLQT